MVTIDSADPSNVPGLFTAQRLYPLLKWAGGKEQELKYILPNLPASYTNYYEPFVGGGAVYTAIQASGYYVNDRSGELISVYRSITDDQRTVFFQSLDDMVAGWDQLTNLATANREYFITVYRQFSADCITDEQVESELVGFIEQNRPILDSLFSSAISFRKEHFITELNKNLVRKIKRVKLIEKGKGPLPDEDVLGNMETAMKSAYYMQIRYIYNHVQAFAAAPGVAAALFLFIRNYAYSGMFRYNGKGGFNVPYGGMEYNRKNFSRKIDYLRSAALRNRLENTTIENLDFESFFQKWPPGQDDFIFLDPPYDSEFSTYAGNEFTRDDQARLADYLLRDCKAKWMLIIKNTDFVYKLYHDKGLNMSMFEKKYLVSFMNRNNRKAEHLLISNYS
ncbi:DNA adenine methylase [Segetibacter sp. 3557_3]|uniref:DNA adenine methylase n=1 Tax=Segetibacter sp. 3557_3 TaxID=2547429 RepID=UPI0010585C87|nr:DNA adenine methylase [Segetibacter sp. 3557_3]TDH23028.1 DNA adenine methylase [Segetibacter sp. 3557_3]